MDMTDMIFPSVSLSQGHTCSQFFVGVTSKLWHITPLKKENQNLISLQDHIWKNDIPGTIISDNALSLGCNQDCVKEYAVFQNL